ncbi:MAG TPA: NAD(P)-dependent oxidoreductase [Caldimonas sp.]|nr:NAD(P)-dependent oxidoreductase [Caldimonas sp.]
MVTVFVSHPPDKLDTYFGAKATEALTAIARVRFNDAPGDASLADLIAAARGCGALIAYRQTAAPEALFRELPELLAFIRCAVDIRTVDVAAASAHGVLVTQASPGFVVAVAEWVIAVMIDLGRGIGRYAAAARENRPLTPFVGRELRGSTLGIVGLGRIGARVADLALAFGMRVLATTPQAIDDRAGRIGQVPLTQLLGESDFVVCLAPAQADTDRLMNATAFAAMRRGAFFINASRGELVDDAALLAALDSGHLGGAALDVGRAPDQMPAPQFVRHPRVIATPHIGGLTQAAIEHQALETVAQLARLLEGEMPVGAVNPDHAHRWRRWRDRRQEEGTA